ncbi:MAG: hypothetical protein JSW58_16130 [Candidatus Latescibacterota bacterium]|nr:MAG: hypothetical protein JSW58_16130 [Candidatus Latescibacterota bacterium]
MNAIAVACWLVGLVLTFSWLAVVRRHVLAGHGLMMNKTNTAMLWVCALALVGIHPMLSAPHFLWMFPLGWLLGFLSVRVVPLFLLGIPGTMFGNMCCVGLDKSLIALNNAKYARYQELVEDLDYSPKEAREVIAREFASTDSNPDFGEDDGKHNGTRPTKKTPRATSRHQHACSLFPSDLTVDAPVGSPGDGMATSAEIGQMTALAWDVWQRSKLEVTYPKGTMTLGIVAMILDELEATVAARERNPQQYGFGHEAPPGAPDSTGIILDDLRELAARADGLAGRCPPFSSEYFHGPGSESAIAAILDDMVAHTEARMRRALTTDVLLQRRCASLTKDRPVPSKASASDGS